MIRLFKSQCTGTCGLAVVHGFNNREYEHSAYDDCTRPINNLGPIKGIGFFVAGFLDTFRCKKTYEEFCSTYKVVYQSPVRRNTNSNNMFFFVIFDSL